MNKLSTYDIHRLAIISDIDQNLSIDAQIYQATTLHESEGSGFIDIANFQRLQIVRSHFTLNQRKSIQRDIPLHFFGANLFLEGDHTIIFPEMNQTIKIEAPCLLFRKGYLGRTLINLPAQKPINILSLDFDKKLLESLDTWNSDSHLLQFNESLDQLNLIPTVSPEILQLLQKILYFGECHNLLELIQFESLSLSLLTLLIEEDHEQQPFSSLVQNALQILSNNLEKKITIVQLSRLIGSNECTLKRVFKQETGFTIHEYRTKQKMKEALKLLNLRYSLIEIADLLGYSNVYYFIRIFKNHFGYLPIEYPSKNKI